MNYLDSVLEYFILIVEIVSVLIIMKAFISGVYHYFMKKCNPVLVIGEDLAFALTLLMVAELLETLLITDIRSAVKLGLILFLRIVISFVNAYHMTEESQ